ncbi:MAG: hypothetical protein LBB41_07510 [Prevotellaceae bacterium]|jgi:hypothetical protein|nr:hypothetical protein [Prevotellaceae bacterium]
MKKFSRNFTITQHHYEGDNIENIVEIDGAVVFAEKKNRRDSGARSFVDDFISRFTTGYKADKCPCNSSEIIGDSGDLLCLISQSRLQTFDLKQKFFYFLLKKLFLCDKTSAVENIKRLCINDKVEFWRRPYKIQPTDTSI